MPGAGAICCCIIKTGSVMSECGGKASGSGFWRSYATLELERLTDGLVAGRGGKLIKKSNHDRNGHPQTLIYERGDPHLLMHLTGIIQSLLKSLGLDKEPKPELPKP